MSTPSDPAAHEPPLVAQAPDAPRVPGTPRERFDRLPTAAVPTQSQSGPAEDGSGADVLPAWMPPPEPARPRRGSAGWALAFSILALIVSLFVGWGLPLGLVGIVGAVFAMRRPWESRAVAVWALVLGCSATLYSAGWLVWAAGRM
ncbi:MAG: hypothetical protein ACK5IN_00950 [Microbacterium sp.]|uniref:hypothetical protein n=1 Tax=Microbacterium sp. TaxID=51671 RepID=UPI003A8950FF